MFLDNAPVRHTHTTVIDDLTPALTAAGIAALAALATAGAAARVDLQQRRLPNRLVAITATLAAAAIVAAWIHDNNTQPVRLVLALAVNAGPLLVMWLIAPNQIGAGDIKLAAALAPLAAWPTSGILPLPLIAALITATPHAITPTRTRTGVPFGPYLVAGTALALTANLALT